MLQQRGYYNIELESGDTIRLRFCTWTFKRFCEVNGNLSLSQLQEMLMHGFSFGQFISLILCASEYEFAKDGKSCPYSEVNASDWIDELGGIASDKFVDMIKIVTSSFGGNKNGESKDQKKSQQNTQVQKS